MSEYAKAEPLCRQALEINRQVLGDNHPDTATSLNNLAGLYNSMGDYAQAEPLYRQAIETYKKVLGDKHPRTATSLNNLALLYESMGDSAKAEPFFRQAWRFMRSTLLTRCRSNPNNNNSRWRSFSEAISMPIWRSPRTRR